MIKNQRLFFVWGIRRSGIHFVSNWIESQFLSPTHIFNNANLKFLSDSHTQHKLFTHSPSWTKECNCRIIIIEEQNILALQEVIKSDNLINCVGQYEQFIKHAMILRDPYNLFASRIKHYGLLSSKGRWINTNFAKLNWIEYAKYWLENKESEDFIKISYNHLVTDSDYRTDTFTMINGEKFDEENLNRIDDNGRGSSFDGQDFQNNASEMKILNRWEMYKDNEAFQNLFTDEIKQLSKEIFNFNPI